MADARRPACEIFPDSGIVERDSPWPCPYSHRVHIHLRSLWLEIRTAGHRYANSIGDDLALQQNFQKCMRQLYPG
jgi:hypothetical protein